MQHLVPTVLFALLTIHGAVAQGLPERALVGYWHNWGWSPNTLALSAIPAEYDVINVAFATPGAPQGASMQFAPDPGIYPSSQAFLQDVQALQAIGKKVLISIGGANHPVHLRSSADVQSFVTSMLQIVQTYGFDGLDIDLEGQSLLLQAGDRDFRSPTTPGIVNFIAAVRQLLAQLPAGFLLSAAPETAHVQGGYSAYGGVWGAYLPVLHALRGELDCVHVQHYNTGSMHGRSGRIYTPATADFHVAMADMLLAGFPVDRHGANIPFPPFAPHQVAIGLPAAPRAAGSGYTPHQVVHAALDHLYLGDSAGSSYALADPGGYRSFRGLMTWSINWDVDAGQSFSLAHREYLDRLFLETDSVSISASGGGIANLSLRAGRIAAGRRYLLLASLGGTSPGTPLPGGATSLPLNLDAFSFLVFDPAASAVFQGFLGSLDAGGEAAARFQLPPLPGLSGIDIDLAYALYGPWDFASPPIRIAITR